MIPASNSILYGSGVFSTIRSIAGELLFWHKHWRRLSDNAAKIGIDLTDISADEVERLAADAAASSGWSSGRVRISLLDDRLSPLWNTGGNDQQKTRVEVTVGEIRPLHPRLKLTASPYSTNSNSPLAGVKSCNYLEQILSLDEAKKRGFHEAIRVNERGFITSACVANVFWLEDGELFTPGLETGCLAGTTREFVLENIDCREVEVGIENLNRAETIFLTSAGLGIVRVAEFDSRALADVSHPILDLWPGP